MGAIGIIDYRMGNLRSVQKALEHVGAEGVILTSPDQVGGVDQLILPGVGAFADGMQHLGELGWIEPMRAFIQSGKPFLGICLGMQLLFDESEEDAESSDTLVPGLGVMAGSVVQFVQPVEGAGGRIKIPHMGWNTLDVRRADGLFTDIAPDSAVYFVHAYYAQPADDDAIIATTDYPEGRPFCCAVGRDNIWATQFHPEKSQRVGLAILRNFTTL